MRDLRETNWNNSKLFATLKLPYPENGIDLDLTEC
jgi:hypothetical protein